MRLSVQPTPLPVPTQQGRFLKLWLSLRTRKLPCGSFVPLQATVAKPIASAAPRRRPTLVLWPTRVLACRGNPGGVDGDFSSKRHRHRPVLGRRTLGLLLYCKRLFMSLRKISPIAMGRPPLALGTATRPAPASTGAAAGQAWPWAKRLPSELLAAVPAGAASSRCCARRPLGPGEVPAGKLQRARTTWSGVTSRAGGRL